MGVPMKGFFNRANVVFATPAPPNAGHKALAKAPTLSTEPVPREEGTHTEGVGETTPLPTETPAPPKRAISPAAVQTKTAPSVLPLVISTSDPFAVISQAAKGGASLVVTPSSIPSKGSDDILEDPDDAPILKKRISDSNEEESASPEPDFMGMYLFFPSLSFSFFIFYVYLHFICTPISLLAESFEGPGIAAGVGMPAPAALVMASPVVPSAPFSAVPTAPASAVPIVLVSATPAAPIPGSSGKFPFPFIIYIYIVFFFL